ncbi:MAG TPA: magnesium transporter [Rhodospirillales bacterium]|nr:magnesium transporter [Rhodospirillales bacterium]
MSDPAETVEADRADKSREGFELDRAVVDAVGEAIERDDHDQVRALLEPVHDADVADLLQNLSSDDRRTVVTALRSDFPPDVLAELDERVRDEVIEELGIAETVNAVRELETDDAVHIISELEEDQQELVLKAIPLQDRTLIEEALAFPDYSAGRLMRRELVAVPVFWTVGDTIDHLRATAETNPDALPDEFFDIFVVDPGHRPVGSVSLSRMLRARRAQPMTEIMTTEMKVIEATTDQEDVAFLFRQRDLTSAPVVDTGGRLVGVITIDDVVDVIDEEHEDDIMRLGGVREDDLYSASVETAQSRFSWLLLNLGTAILASAVIGLFDATIEHMVALAVLMPIVASMGGNAGTQTLTVAVRALATKELTEANARRVIGKEVLVGAMNGLLFAVITGLIAWLWFGSSGLGVVIGLAMIVNLVVAGLFGAVIPLALDRMKIDPAVASAVFLTTVTDVVGFFAFLGLGAWLLL